jgi:choline dehydrogenase-like flavoprotein
VHTVRSGFPVPGTLRLGQVQHRRGHRFLQAEPFDPSEGMHFGNEGTPHHAGGTLRLSDDGTGVVDTDLRFEQLDNLYVADNSVAPFNGSSYFDVMDRW